MASDWQLYQQLNGLSSMGEATELLAHPNSFLVPCRWNLVQFGFICVYTMGLNAIWSFPFLVYRLSGLFLVAYYILLVLICIPVTFIQLRLGGVFRRGIVGLFSHFMPALKGVAVGILAISYICSIYANVYVSHAVYYMFASMKHPYGWTQAENITTYKFDMSSDRHQFLGKTAAENYYYNTFLEKSVSLYDPGGVPWHLGLSLVFVWIVTYLMIFRGPAWFGKVIYVTAPLSVFLLVLTVIYSHAAIPSAYQSLTHFFKQQSTPMVSHTNDIPAADRGILHSELAMPVTWINALKQHIYCVGLWDGVLPTLGNHLGNKKPISNLTWLIVLLVHSILPHMGTIAIAPFIHALAVAKGMPFADVIQNGEKLLFITLPEAFAILDVHPFWAFCFYLMVVIFAIHLQALLLLVIYENIVECFPQHCKVIFKRREYMLGAICTFCFLLSLPHLSKGGSYLTEIVDISLFRLLFVVVVLAIPPLAIAYAKLDPFHLPVERLGMSIWFAVASVVTSALLLYNHVMFNSSGLERKDFTTGQSGLGWLIAVCPLLICSLLGFLHALKTSNMEGWQKLIEVFKPNFDDSNALSRQFSEESTGSLSQNGTGKGKMTRSRSQESRRAEVEVCIPPPTNDPPASL